MTKDKTSSPPDLAKIEEHLNLMRDAVLSLAQDFHELSEDMGMLINVLNPLKPVKVLSDQEEELLSQDELYVYAKEDLQALSVFLQRTRERGAHFENDELDQESQEGLMEKFIPDTLN